MSNDRLLWITEAQVAELIDLESAIDALEAGLKLEAQGQAINIAKALGTWGDGSSAHALGSMFPSEGFAGYKTWVNTKRGATAVFSLFDANNGRLLAMIEAYGLGQLRTSGIAGVATRWLAAGDASVMALVGTGSQAFMQLAAVAAVRSLEQIRVFSRTEARRNAFATEAQRSLGIPVVASSSLEAALDGASIVTTVTRATEPFLHAAQLAPGCHVNAVGAILPANAELHQDVLERADALVVDFLPNVQKASREFIDRFGSAEGNNWASVHVLSGYVAGKRRRGASDGLTVFKAMGMGISDLSIAVAAYRRALDHGIGTVIDQPSRVALRLRADAPAASRP
jgi:ornithine cyclodeaminase/alanine dehydrogenase-like protein (mu-crystallin family)